jgi:hypothetical protein
MPRAAGEMRSAAAETTDACAAEMTAASEVAATTKMTAAATMAATPAMATASAAAAGRIHRARKRERKSNHGKDFEF